MSPKKLVHTILFLEDRHNRADLITAVFKRSESDASVVFVSSLKAALKIIQSGSADALFLRRAICGDDLPGFLSEIHRKGQFDIPVILITEQGGKEDALQAIRAGADDCIPDESGFIDTYPEVAERSIARRDAARLTNEQSHLIVRSQKQWMSILDAIKDYIFVINDEHRLLKVNNSFAAVFGVHPRDVIGKKCEEIFGSDFVIEYPACEIHGDGKLHTYEKTIREENYQISVFPLHEADRCLSVHVMKNITELRRLKEQLHHADKLASIGLLVSGVAHEINNPLTATIAYSELLAMKVSDDDVKRDLEKILGSAERCKKIVDNLLTFSRQRTPSKSLQSINDIVDRAIDLRIYWLRSRNIEVIRNYDPFPTVFVDAQQIQQVILNILLNAEQAIVATAQTRGKITFTTRCKKKERLVVIRILDNGPGIPQQIISKIFDPFFTTKPVGMGTGLGLSISHGIIAEHGGTIRAANDEKGGASFTIELPTGAKASTTITPMRSARE